MANGPKVPLLEIPQPSHFLESNVTAQPVSSDTIPSSSCAPFTPSAAAEPCPPVVTPIASELRSICMHS
ncbi:unnamed protein product [Dibothriocephalus latus]|uniref:Uncharacterized protein n=1 Tax=Dibothriocephalus latus TaxID=60516 RepID=A0A3P6TUT9_DIBLA|nr:unnamed protein product [Dibothriocephalus latus]